MLKFEYRILNLEDTIECIRHGSRFEPVASLLARGFRWVRSDAGPHGWAVFERPYRSEETKAKAKTD